MIGYPSQFIQMRVCHNNRVRRLTNTINANMRPIPQLAVASTTETEYGHVEQTRNGTQPKLVIQQPNLLEQYQTRGYVDQT